MSRGKHPELTVQRILDCSLRLFLARGYENTSIQDITNSLGDLTKGAIYHHFKSKEDILIGVANLLFGEKDKEWEQIVRDPVMTGAEKLSALFLSSLSAPEQFQFFQAAPHMFDNPKLLSLQLHEIVTAIAPRYVEPIVRQGAADGSIRTKYPKQLSQIVLLLTNLWATPLVFYADWDEIWERLQCFEELFAPYGISLCTPVMTDRFRELSRIFSGKQ